jgi:hypothetical protein
LNTNVLHLIFLFLPVVVLWPIYLLCLMKCHLFAKDRPFLYLQLEIGMVSLNVFVPQPIQENLSIRFNVISWCAPPPQTTKYEMKCPFCGVNASDFPCVSPEVTMILQGLSCQWMEHAHLSAAGSTIPLLVIGIDFGRVIQDFLPGHITPTIMLYEL